MSTRATSARAASSSVRTPQYTGKGPTDVDEALQYSTTSGDDDDDELQWEFTGHEEMGTSQLGGAPIGTQGVEYTQEEYRHVEHQVPILCFYFSIFANYSLGYLFAGYFVHTGDGPCP